MSATGESAGVVEIDAIGVDEWEHEQHTPRAMDENLAALVKQSSAQSGPVRAPTIDDEWDADALAAGSAGPAKQRTTTNTVARPAPPKTKTMTMPAVAVPAAPKPVAPATPKAIAVPKLVPRAETQAIVSPAAKKIPAKPVVNDGPPPGFVEVKPLAARGTPPPPTAARVTKTRPSTGIAKPAAKLEPKPTAKSTPPPIAAVDPKPAPPSPTQPPVVVAAVEPKPPQPTPPPFSPMILPAWPPAAPSRPVASDFKPEDSVIVDLDATSPTDRPRRPQSYPVIQTSEHTPSTSGAFVMPTAAQPTATQVAAERGLAPELPPPPVAPVGASARTDADRTSAPVWNTPLPQRLPSEPVAAPAAAGWPSAAGLAYAPNAPLAHAPAAPLAAQRTVVAARPPLVRRRGVVIAIAGATVIAIVLAISALGGRDSQQPAIVATSTSTSATTAPKAGPTASADATSPHAAPAHADALSAPVTTAAVEAVAPPLKVPAKPPVATHHRISRSKKPVVVDYDKQPSSPPLDVDQALAQARAAYSIGNQHLFAGDGREAIVAYRKALAIYPSYAAGYRGLGLAFAQLDDKPSAIAAFTTYVKLAPAAKDVALIQKRIRNLSVR